jgi:hypothetical protein
MTAALPSAPADAERGPRSCGLFCFYIWHALAIYGSTKHGFSMALKLVLSASDTMIDADTMLGFLMFSWY